MAQSPPPLYDLHSHVLPDLDDGAHDLEMTLAMFRLSVERGVTGIVATPHSQHVDDRGGIPTFNDRFGRARALLDEHSIPLDLLRGMEVRLVPDVPDRLAAGQYLPLGDSTHVLVEFDYTQWANYTEDVLFSIALAGFKPLLAHVERIEPLRKDPGKVLRMVAQGYHAQITAMSLLGGFGSSAQSTAEHLLMRGAVHVVASDTHRTNGSRQPWPNGTAKRLAEVVGEEAAHTLIYDNPARLLRGETLHTIEPKPHKRRRWGFLPF